MAREAANDATSRLTAPDRLALAGISLSAARVGEWRREAWSRTAQTEGGGGGCSGGAMGRRGAGVGAVGASRGRHPRREDVG